MFFGNNGNLTFDGINSYEYDFENRLITVHCPLLTVNFEYDAFGRRLTKDDGRGTIIRYVYDGDRVIAEYNGDTDELLAKYTYGPGIDEHILMQRGGESYYYHFDGLGSVTGLTDSTGETIETYQYDVYGQPSSASSIGNPYYFTGREYDSETGLCYYRARYYSPAIGRFLQRDLMTWQPNDSRLLNSYSFNKEIAQISLIPLLDQNTINSTLGVFEHYPQSLQSFGLSNPSYLNLYLYCSNNPVNWIDPWGYGKKEPWWQPTLPRVFRWGGRALQEAGLKGLGKALGLMGVMLETGGTGKIVGIVVGGTIGAGVGGIAGTAVTPGSGTAVGAVTGGILGGMVGGAIGSWFDSPYAGFAY